MAYEEGPGVNGVEASGVQIDRLISSAEQLLQFETDYYGKEITLVVSDPDTLFTFSQHNTESSGKVRSSIKMSIDVGDFDEFAVLLGYGENIEINRTLNEDEIQLFSKKINEAIDNESLNSVELAILSQFRTIIYSLGDDFVPTNENMGNITDNTNEFYGFSLYNLLGSVIDQQCRVTVKYRQYSYEYVDGSELEVTSYELLPDSPEFEDIVRYPVLQISFADTVSETVYKFSKMNEDDMELTTEVDVEDEVFEDLAILDDEVLRAFNEDIGSLKLGKNHIKFLRDRLNEEISRISEGVYELN